MNIAVCICQVPDTASIIGFDHGKVDLSMINEVMNPYDEYALEEAVCLKEHVEGGVVTVFTLAPASAKEMLRKALAMGADRAVLVSSCEVFDPFQIADALFRAILAFYSDKKPDIVLCGKQSTDFQNAQVPPMLAELLGIGVVTGITALHASIDGIEVEREIEGGVEYFDVRYPAVLSAEKGLNTPRKTNIKAVMEARKKTIDSFPFIHQVVSRVVMTDLNPLERRKKCNFISDEHELIRILSVEYALF